MFISFERINSKYCEMKFSQRWFWTSSKTVLYSFYQLEFHNDEDNYLEYLHLISMKGMKSSLGTNSFLFIKQKKEKNYLTLVNLCNLVLSSFSYEVRKRQQISNVFLITPEHIYSIFLGRQCIFRDTFV